MVFAATRRKRVASFGAPTHNSLRLAQQGGIVASHLSISRAWDQTREIFRRDGGLITAVALALIVLPEVAVGIIAPPETGSAEPTASAQMLRLLAGLVSLVGQISIIRLALGPSTTVGAAISHGLRRFPSTFGALVLLIILMAIVVIPTAAILSVLMGVDLTHLRQTPSSGMAMLFLIVTIIVLVISVRFTLLTPTGSAEDLGPWGIFKRTWQLTSGHFWRLFGLVVLLLIAAIFLLFTASLVGSLLARLVGGDITAFSVGALIVSLVAGAAQGAFSILASVMLARVYSQVAGRDAEASVPSTGD